jgi:AraC-like DNA-binding protein
VWASHFSGRSSPVESAARHGGPRRKEVRICTSRQLAAKVGVGLFRVSPSPPHAHVLAISGTAMESPAPQCRAESGRPGLDPRTASPGLAELGRRVGESERTLSRLFRDEVGMGYTVWPQPTLTALGGPDARWGQDGYSDCQRLRLFLRPAAVSDGQVGHGAPPRD